MSQFFVENFVSQYRKSLEGNPSRLRFGKILVAKQFIDKKWGEYQDFPSNIFCLAVPKNFEREPIYIVYFLVAKMFIDKKKWG